MKRYEEMSNYEKRMMLDLLINYQNSDFGCPPEELRVIGHTTCFNCTDCKKYALMNDLELL